MKRHSIPFCVRAIATLLTVTLASAGVSDAADSPPVECVTAKPYEGRPLHFAPPADRFLVAGALSGAFDTETIARLRKALSKAMTATKAQAITVSVARPGEAIWSSLETKDRAASVPERFWWASAGKMFTAVVVLQLVEEEKIALTDPISKYVLGVPNGDAITIEHLLDHTSGLFSANEDELARADPRRRTLEEELVIVRRHGALFCPGQAWRYTNTGYSLLGAVIEKVEGRPYAEVLTRRVVDRLGLSSIRVLKSDDAATDVAPLAPTNPKEPRVHPSWAGAAGAISGRAEDMNRFLQGLLSSELLKPETTRRQFARLYPMFDENTFYGLGVMVYEPRGAGIYWLGHSGGAPGVKAISIWSPQDRAFVSVALTGDGSAEATANLLLRALPKARRTTSE